MNIVDRFIEQHRQIVSLCNELAYYAHKDHIQNNVAQASTIQDNLCEVLGSHLRLEDLSLYPMLVEHKDETIKSIALGLKEKVSGCTRLFNAYREKYPNQKSIEADTNAYSEDTLEMVRSILERIKKEETQLYSLLR